VSEPMLQSTQDERGGRLLGVLRSSGSERPTRLVQAVMRQTSSSRHDVREALRELVDRREVALNRQGELTSDTTKPSPWLLTSSPIVHGGGKKDDDRRGEFQRDRDRLLYSTALRRLAGITQVVSAAEGHVFHNRLTPTLEVAQWARRLAGDAVPKSGSR
jgi:hypothetical protein